jgi:aspartyl-tRNA(Asn)/glutamyl-tRNA(Gln) amidotransferase subunit B
MSHVDPIGSVPLRRSGYQVVVGLEVHLALRTRSKLFCSCPAEPSAQPNRHVCSVCAGLPGALPVANDHAVELAVRFADALGCEIPAVTTFARKHYGYPDNPKNYQISQHDRPVGSGGAVQIPGGRRIGIVRCHLEEDAGRLLHPTYAPHSLVDLDRAGAPLIELVSRPDIHSGDEARAFLEEVRAIARALGVSDATPEEGRMRADVNISLRRPGEPLGTKVEVKNLNSFKSVQAAIESEAQRQERLLQAGRSVAQETRGWNEGGQKSSVLRSKEEAADYRYLDDPDLPPIRLSAEWLAAIRADTPPTPAALRRHYTAAGLRPEDADRLASDIELAHAFDTLMRAATAAAAASPQALANWLLVEAVGWANANGHTIPSLGLHLDGPATRLARLVALLEAGTINGPTAKGILGEVLSGAEPQELVAARGLQQVEDASSLALWVAAVLAEHALVAQGARENPKALNFLMGKVMQRSGGQARPDAVRALLRERLDLSEG